MTFEIYASAEKINLTKLISMQDYNNLEIFSVDYSTPEIKIIFPVNEEMKYIVIPMKTNKWHLIQVGQKKEGVFYRYFIRIGKKVMHTVINRNATQYINVTVAPIADDNIRKFKVLDKGILLFYTKREILFCSCLGIMPKEV